MKNEREDVNGGYIFFPGLQSVLADRSYRFDGRVNSPEVLAPPRHELHGDWASPR